MQTVIAFVFGLFIGSLFAGLLFHRKAKPVCGALRVDTSDPQDGPYLFLELTEGLDKVANSRQVTFDVKVENYISQK